MITQHPSSSDSVLCDCFALPEFYLKSIKANGTPFIYPSASNNIYPASELEWCQGCIMARECGYAFIITFSCGEREAHALQLSFC